MTATPAATLPPALQKLLTTLTLERLDDNLFRGPSASEGWQRVYGGQVLGQALLASAGTVEAGRELHSMHAYFLLGGDPAFDIVYEVDRIRDGGSFTTRRVRALQHGRAIFTMAASYHKGEDSYDHQSAMPDVPKPDALPSMTELMAKVATQLPANMRAYWERERPLDVRIVDPSRYISRTPRTPTQALWLKTTAPLAEDLALHQAVLAYASDFTLLDTALIAHGKLLFDSDIQLASLDHAMWFHRPLRIDEWVLYVQDSPTAFGARGFCRGSVYDLKGRLVASVAQEGLMRKRDTAFVLK